MSNLQAVVLGFILIAGFSYMVFDNIMLRKRIKKIEKFMYKKFKQNE